MIFVVAQFIAPPENDLPAANMTDFSIDIESTSPDIFNYDTPPPSYDQVIRARGESNPSNIHRVQIDSISKFGKINESRKLSRNLISHLPSLLIYKYYILLDTTDVNVSDQGIEVQNHIAHGTRNQMQFSSHSTTEEPLSAGLESRNVCEIWFLPEELQAPELGTLVPFPPGLRHSYDVV